MKIKVLKYGGSFPNFHASTILIQTTEKNIVFDPGFTGDQKIILDSLASEGLAPEDINFIINSHHHLDHCANNEMFLKAKFVIHQEEYKLINIALNNPMGIKDIAKSLTDYYKLRSSQARALANIINRNQHIWKDIINNKDRLLLLNEDECEFDKDIQIISTPGHTPGHISVILQDNRNHARICIAGDALVSKAMYQMENNIETLLTLDLKQFLISKRLIEQSNCDIIIPGHGKPFDTRTRENIESLTKIQSNVQV